MFFGHDTCKDDIHALTQTNNDYEKKIRRFDREILSLINQIQELKAINNYQAWEFEQKIFKLEQELSKYKDVNTKNEDTP